MSTTASLSVAAPPSAGARGPQGFQPWLHDRTPVLLPLALLTFVNVLSLLALRPAVRQVFAGAPGRVEAVDTALWISAAGSPAFGLLKAALVATLVWAVGALVGEVYRWRWLLSIAACGEVIRAGVGLFVAGVLHLRGIASLRAPDDLRVPTGLDLVTPFDSPVWTAVAQQFTLFHVAWAAFLVWSLWSDREARRAPAVVAALTAWAAGAAYAALRAA